MSESGAALSSTTGQNETNLQARQLDLRFISTESKDSEPKSNENWSSSCIAFKAMPV